MVFRTATTSVVIRSREHLTALIDQAMRERMKFELGRNDNHYLKLVFYSDEGSFLELHRGKKWDAWISPALATRDEIRQVFVEYFERGDLSDERLHRDPEWLEASVLHPAVYLILALLAVGFVIFIVIVK